nr:hypothetical protein [uncultured Agathobaculum sp.]
MQPVYPHLYQFSTYIPPLDFTIHQYLLCTEPAVLFASGTMQQAEQILPQVQEILAGRPLGYIFVSHMESDECGGLAVFLRAYPAVTVVCSPLCARAARLWLYRPHPDRRTGHAPAGRRARPALYPLSCRGAPAGWSGVL